MVTYSSGDRYHLQGVRSSLHRSRHESKRKAAHMSSISDPWLRRKTSSVKFSHLSESYHDPHYSSWAPERVVCQLLSEVPPELPMPWSLLVQLHVTKFHKGIQSLRLHVWNLYQVTQTKGRIFQGSCSGCPLRISEDSRHVYTKKNGPDSSISVVEEILLHKRPLSSK